MTYCEKYSYAPDLEIMEDAFAGISGKISEMMNDEVLKKCFSFMDITSLKNDDTEEKIAAFVSKVNSFALQYPDYPLPASICVYPDLVSTVAGQRTVDIRATAVAGGFPTSQTFLEVKLREIEMAMASGADEIDIVLPLHHFLAGDKTSSFQELKAIRSLIDDFSEKNARKVILKTILETGLLVTAENIAEASFLAMEAGTDFIKTSTGKVEVNATPAAAWVMCGCIKAYYEKTGRKVGFKAAGGLSSASDAVSYYCIVSCILGQEWLCPQLFRFGVSRMANNILSALEKTKVNFF